MRLVGSAAGVAHVAIVRTDVARRSSMTSTRPTLYGSRHAVYAGHYLPAAAGAAIRYAREGFAVFEYMATMIKQYEDGYRSWPSNAAIFLPGGKLPQVGDRFLQTDLAGTLQYMVDQERAAEKRGRLAGLQAARAAFYCGDIAETIVRYHEQNGGYLARDDLANFHSRYEAPVKVRWRDFEVFTCGPWCQGPMLAQALRMIEAAGGLKGLQHN